MNAKRSGPSWKYRRAPLKQSPRNCMTYIGQMLSVVKLSLSVLPIPKRPSGAGDGAAFATGTE
ncbi:MAG: hypothetical protein WDO19_11070 [Bacteroidota bacterium]